MAPYEVFAIRYGSIEERLHRQNFMVPDQHDYPMPLYYYVWVIRQGDKVWLFDTGFSEETAKRRGRVIARPVAEGLRALGIDPAQVQNVILSHMHYDHAGNQPLFPNAKFHLQEREMQYCTGRCMCEHFNRHHYQVDDVQEIVGRIFREQVQFHNGSSELADGLSLHLIGGHTRGLQVVRVLTRRGWVVLASDSAHYYDNFRLGMPFPAAVDVAEMIEGFHTLRRLADSDDHIIPGHDPTVERFYPQHNGIPGICRLDVAPIFSANGLKT